MDEGKLVLKCPPQQACWNEQYYVSQELACILYSNNTVYGFPSSAALKRNFQFSGIILPTGIRVLNIFFFFFANYPFFYQFHIKYMMSKLWEIIKPCIVGSGHWQTHVDIRTFLINLGNVWKNVQNGKPPSSLASLLIRKMFWGSNPSRPGWKIQSQRRLLFQQLTLSLRKKFCAWLLTCSWQGKHLSALSCLYVSMCITQHHGKKRSHSANVPNDTGPDI